MSTSSNLPKRGAAVKRGGPVSEKAQAPLPKEKRAHKRLFDGLRKRVGEDVWRQWQAKSRSQDAFAILCLLASYGLEGVIPHGLLVIETELSPRQVARHLATLRANGLLWRSPGYKRYAIRTELFPVIRRGPIIGLDAAMEYHRNRRRVRAATTLSYSPSLGRERHLDSISLATAQSAKADFQRLRSRKPLHAGGRYRFNHAALRDILKALHITFRDRPEEFLMRCFVSPKCWAHRTPTLYLRHDGPRAGAWYCHRCNGTGFVNNLVAVKTGWDRQEISAFLNEHQAYDDPDDAVRQARPLAASVDLRKYTAQPHPYCSEERHLTNETLRRYKIGYDLHQAAVTIPIYDAQHTLVALKRRQIDSKRYNVVTIQTGGGAFFGIDKIKPNSTVWLCEGEFDAMFVDQCLRDLFQHQGAIALSGKYLTEQKLSALIALQPVMFVDALDNDGAGREASAAMRGRLERIAPVMRMDYEAFTVKDPNDSSPRQIVQQAYRANAFLHAQTEKSRAS